MFNVVRRSEAMEQTLFINKILKVLCGDVAAFCATRPAMFKAIRNHPYRHRQSYKYHFSSETRERDAAFESSTKSWGDLTEKTENR